MLQPFPAHLPIPPPQSLRLAITQLQHDRCIAQLQRPTAHSPHDFHPLQLTTAHGCPLQQDLPWLEVLVYGDISNESARGHYQRVSTSLTTPVLSRDLGSGFCKSGHTSSTAQTHWFLSRE